MKAVIYRSYGTPSELRIEEVEKPVPKDDEILIKIHAVSINGSDREALIGKPFYVRAGGLLRPRAQILGSDIAGRVEAIGKNVTEFTKGDDVFGELPGYHGGLAEYVCSSGKTLAIKPAGMTFTEAAAIPQGGIIALQGIREKGQVQRGQRVLINGAGGSAGSFAVQIARLIGAEVTGVDNSRKLDFVRSLGADHVVDYTREDFTRLGKSYHLILDLIANRSIFSSLRALKPNGTYFFVGGSVFVLFQILILGPLIRRFTGKNIQLLIVPQSRSGLLGIMELCSSKEIVPVIDRTFSFSEASEAFRYVLEGRSKGKVVISMDVA